MTDLIALLLLAASLGLNTGLVIALITHRSTIESLTIQNTSLLDRVQAPEHAANSAVARLSSLTPSEPVPERQFIRSRGGVVRVPVPDTEDS